MPERVEVATASPALRQIRSIARLASMSVFCDPSRFRTTKPSRIVAMCRSASYSRLVIGTVRRPCHGPAQANLALQVITDRDYRRSTCITTNRLFEDWPKAFPDALNDQVIAERLTEHHERFIFDGKGYRLPHAT